MIVFVKGIPVFSLNVFSLATRFVSGQTFRNEEPPSPVYFSLQNRHVYTIYGFFMINCCSKSRSIRYKSEISIDSFISDLPWWQIFVSMSDVKRTFSRATACFTSLSSSSVKKPRCIVDEVFLLHI